MKAIVVFFVLLSGVVSTLHAADRSVKVAILISAEEQMAAYNSLFSQFENSSRIDVQLDFYSDISFKKHIDSWIELGAYDVLYWQAGNRLKSLVDKKEVVPLDDLLDLTNLKLQYKRNALNAVIYNKMTYALPIGHYIWGFYYSKPIFEKFELTPPKTWEQFQYVATTLKQNGVVPLIQATADQWPVLAWLDYASMQLGGSDYRQQLIDGNFGDDVILDQQLFDFFDYLVSNNLFFAANHDWSWDQTIPAITRRRAAMTLTGQFVEANVKKIANNEIGFFPFPTINVNSQSFEVAPMEVLVVPTSSNKQTEVAKLLEFVIGYMAIDGLASQLDWLSVSNQYVTSSTSTQRTNIAQKKVDNASLLVQYFDREASPNVSLAWANAIISAIKNGSSEPLKTIDTSTPATITLESTEQRTNEKLFSLSTIGGKGSYLFSNIMHHVYGMLGRETVVNRFDDSAAAINSLKYGADGDLIRIEDTPELNKLAVKISEPMTRSRLYLVGKKNTCDLTNETLPTGSKLHIALDVKFLNKWAKRLKPMTSKITSYEQTWHALAKGQTDYIIAFETEMYAKRNKLSNLCFTHLETVESFHYIANKHRGLKSNITNALIKFKKTDKYQEIITSFGLGVLPDKG